MDQRVIEAVRSRRVLKLRYYGRSRVVEPHACGVDRLGDDILLCHEPDSGSWQRLRLFEVLSIAVLDDTFPGPRPGYQRDDPAFASVAAQL
ncbi:WYL domain-containing protein [Noviherbaspirillum aridicola]|uniref:WYL domain-containing protein n=1 Tax=Noviherbaspirillum aridicola TaxID=2849687 RepID=A0ABQ4PZ33_9BURK|nr:WYL domain-containing protein [Noviherbaspirillum aridicola]GIZ50113.1 hypothetical protein NCCP691_01270 [Noviherbaspirillum aridicola]